MLWSNSRALAGSRCAERTAARGATAASRVLPPFDAASEYLSTKSDAAREKHPLRAALYRNVTVTVAILIIPLSALFECRHGTGRYASAALTVIALFNYYYAVVRAAKVSGSVFRHFEFRHRRDQFSIGYGLKYFTA